MADNGLSTVVPAGNDFMAISASDNPFALALRTDGSIVGWGYRQAIRDALTPTDTDQPPEKS